CVGIKMSRLHTYLLLLSSLLLSGCGMPLLSGAKVETNNTIAKPPSDVTVYVSVKDSGKPVGHLSADNFHIYENDVLLSESEIGLRLLSRDTVAAGFTVLLLDLS